MTYTGDVSVGGPADTRELPGLTITKVAVGPMDNNAYLLRCTQTGELALIDAANEANTLLALIGDTPLATVITTHQHWDHHAALREVQQATGAATVAHPDDAPGIPIPVTRPVRHGDTVAVGNAVLSSFTCAATRPAASRCALTGTELSPTSLISSPATRSSPAVLATPSTTRPVSTR